MRDGRTELGAARRGEAEEAARAAAWMERHGRREGGSRQSAVVRLSARDAERRIGDLGNREFGTRIFF